uniref:Uncharacterized protein n=1 Tax=Arundo donax TaxID=35708 RepID=A0A0A8ZCV6_ARUDO
MLYISREEIGLPSNEKVKN